jgi:hypothetical protein
MGTLEFAKKYIASCVTLSLLSLYFEDPLENLNEWSRNTNKLMDLVMKTTHLINKEEMVNHVNHSPTQST